MLLKVFVFVKMLIISWVPHWNPQANLLTKTISPKENTEKGGSWRDLLRKPFNHALYGGFADMILLSEMLVDAFLGYAVTP
jgi:hypothetical protein